MKDVEAVLRQADSQFLAINRWPTADGTNRVFSLNIELEVDNSGSCGGDSELYI